MNSIFDIPVSYYRNYQDTEGVTIPLHDALTKHRPEHIRQLERVRAAANDEEKNRLKKPLPVFTPSACLLNRKADVPLPEKLVSHTGFIQFDIDPKDNPDMNACQIRDAMAPVSYTHLAGVWKVFSLQSMA